MTKLFRNDSPGALTLEQARELEIKRHRERRRQAAELAAQGRGEDTEIAHVAHGELIVPEILQTPEFMEVIGRTAAECGIPLERLFVGSKENSVNPGTGAREFFFDGLTRGIGDFFRTDRSPSASPAQQATMPKLESLPAIPFTPPTGLVDPVLINRNSSQFNPGRVNVDAGDQSYQIDGANLDDSETLRRARVVFGETRGMRPALIDPNRSVNNPGNWDQQSADDFARGRAYVGVVSARNDNTHSADPDMNKSLDRQQWDLALDAARASRHMDGTLSPNITNFFFRQEGAGQNIPYKNTLLPSPGPFVKTAGGDVPRGNRTFFDFYRWGQ